MQIIENKALLLSLRNPERVSAVIPRSKVLGNGTVLVKWGLDEAQVLRTCTSRMCHLRYWGTTIGPECISHSLTRKKLRRS
jgi:hypothetical protein